MQHVSLELEGHGGSALVCGDDEGVMVLSGIIPSPRVISRWAWCGITVGILCNGPKDFLRSMSCPISNWHWAEGAWETPVTAPSRASK